MSARAVVSAALVGDKGGDAAAPHDSQQLTILGDTGPTASKGPARRQKRAGVHANPALDGEGGGSAVPQARTARRQRTPAAAADSAVQVSAEGDADTPPRKPRRRRTAPAAAEVGQVAPAATPGRDDVSSLAALFAEALAPAGAGASTSAAAPKKRGRKRKAAPVDGYSTPALTLRPDPWARYAGLFAPAAAQRVQSKGGADNTARTAAAVKGKSGASGGGSASSPSAGSSSTTSASSGQHQQAPPARASARTADFAERTRALFGGTLATGRLSVRRLPTGTPLVPATPAPSAKAAAQRLASGLLQGPSSDRQRGLKGKRRGAATEAAAAASQQRVYVPEAASTAVTLGGDAATARSEARSEALRRMRVRTIRAYDELLARALEWQAQGRHYILDAPNHLPVAVQRGWSPQGGGGLSDEDHLRLATISAEVQRALGVALPERALRGERGALLAAQSARHVAVRLSEWVGVCGADYVRQLVGVEPCVLAAPPQALLSTLEALNRHAELEPQDAVAYLLRHPALVGLSPSELEERLEGVAAAVGLAPDEARKMVLERPELLMLTPQRLEETMEMVEQLLPGVDDRLPSMVARRPQLVLRSPRTLARDIRQLAATLGLTNWAAGRLVAGGSGILELSLTTLAARLQRLKDLCSAHPSWRQQLTAMSPGGLGRCLRCNDAAFERLSLLAAAGLAGSRRVPKVKRILTLPAGRFDALFQQLGLARGVRSGAAATRASASFSDASSDGAPGAQAAGDESDSDDEEDSGMLWPPAEDARNGLTALNISGGSSPVVAGMVAEEPASMDLTEDARSPVLSAV